MYYLKDAPIFQEKEGNDSASHLGKWACFVAWQFSPFTIFRNTNNWHIPFEKNRTVCHLALNTYECTRVLVHQNKKNKKCKKGQHCTSIVYILKQRTCAIIS